MLDKYITDSIIYGYGFLKTGYRAWYNPVRYFKGRYYLKRISLEKVYKRKGITIAALIAAVYATLFILVLYGLFFCEEVLK